MCRGLKGVCAIGSRRYGIWVVVWRGLKEIWDTGGVCIHRSEKITGSRAAAITGVLPEANSYLDSGEVRTFKSQ